MVFLLVVAVLYVVVFPLSLILSFSYTCLCSLSHEVLFCASTRIKLFFVFCIKEFLTLFFYH